METNYKKISVRPVTKELFKKCYKEFLENKPDFAGMKLSEDFMLTKICNYFLER